MSYFSITRSLPIFFLLLACGCTSSTESPAIKALEKRLSQAQEVVSKIDETIKKVPEQNQGLLIELSKEKQLARSRLERLKENLLVLSPKKLLEGESAPPQGH
ncbi:MAG: hypothetical protein EXR74_07525 [Bdellovibrionales bacterium]|nr:hypothetical protein [Bdellovibrionales bacterium]